MESIGTIKTIVLQGVKLQATHSATMTLGSDDWKDYLALLIASLADTLRLILRRMQCGA